MAKLGQPARLAVALAGQPRILVGGGVGLVPALPLLEVALAVAPRQRRLPEPSFGRKLFIDAHAFNSVPLTAMLGAQKLFHSRQPQQGGDRNPLRDLLFSNRSRFLENTDASNTASSIPSPTNQRNSRSTRAARQADARSGWNKASAAGRAQQPLRRDRRPPAPLVERIERGIHPARPAPPRSRSRALPATGAAPERAPRDRHRKTANRPSDLRRALASPAIRPPTPENHDRQTANSRACPPDFFSSLLERNGNLRRSSVVSRARGLPPSRISEPDVNRRCVEERDHDADEACDGGDGKIEPACDDKRRSGRGHQPDERDIGPDRQHVPDGEEERRKDRENDDQRDIEEEQDRDARPRSRQQCGEPLARPGGDL